ncbi:GNAT family N-acetyltransferase [Mobilicoccus massiliensis]|uniref:GNAT family N-acetyltransferase n=1 Tax=Mobilicoccus massiliensis TaxID=1522310 RepID=UPI00058D1AB1|nr:GNAT family N-acetyltransferase [Mobilicoccus massiliensis]
MNELLRAYDDIRGEREVPGAVSVRADGEVVVARFTGGRGFVTHRHEALAGLGDDEIARLVDRVLTTFVEDPDIERVEWKTRAHDPNGDVLERALTSHGFTPDEAESVMIGRAGDLAVDVPLPEGVTIRRIHSERDVRAMCAMTDEAFGDPPSDRIAEALLHRLSLGRDDMEVWVADLDGELVCGGRLEPVAGSRIAGLWGGATRGDQRGRGIYRALTAARARSAIARGFDYLHSDSTEYSRPILARAGFERVTTTTPYEWRR